MPINPASLDRLAPRLEALGLSLSPSGRSDAGDAIEAAAASLTQGGDTVSRATAQVPLSLTITANTPATQESAILSPAGREQLAQVIESWLSDVFKRPVSVAVEAPEPPPEVSSARAPEPVQEPKPLGMAPVVETALAVAASLRMQATLPATRTTPAQGMAISVQIAKATGESASTTFERRG